MSDDVSGEFWSKVELLLDSSEMLAESLLDDAPSEPSRAFYRRSASGVLSAAQNLRAVLGNSGRAEEVAQAVQELKQVLVRLGVSSAKSEVPLGNPALLAQCLDLIYVFQEARYAEVSRRPA